MLLSICEVTELFFIFYNLFVVLFYRIHVPIYFTDACYSVFLQMKLLLFQRLAGATLLVFANKQDLPGALTSQEIRQASTILLITRVCECVYVTMCLN